MVDYEAAKNVLSWLSDRLREKSTYVGLGMLAAAIGLPLAGFTADSVYQYGMVFGSLLAVLVKDSK